MDRSLERSGGEQVARVPDVVGGEFPDGVGDIGAASREFADLLLVGRAVLERGLEDDGFVLTPMCKSAIGFFRFPGCKRCRERSSSQRDNPASDRSANGVAIGRDHAAAGRVDGALRRSCPLNQWSLRQCIKLD